MRRLLALPLLAGVLVAAGLPVVSDAGAATAATSFPRLPVFAAKTDQYSTWYDKAITTEQFSSPAVGDVTGDGQPDVVAGYPDGNVYVFNAATGAREYKRYVGPGAVLASPNLVDLNGDGRLDILVATANGATNSEGGNVIAFDTNGVTLFSKKTGDGVHQAGDFATPQAADIDHDGQKEIIESSWDHHIYVWKLNGSLLWSYFTKDTVWSTPAIADLNGDGWLDIAFGYDCDGVAGQDCYNGHTYGQRGGYIAVLDHVGRLEWRRFYKGQVIWSSPVIADIDKDGNPDIVIGTGNMSGVNMTGGHQVLAFRGKDGAYLPGFPVNVGGKVMGTPAIGDVNGDGRLDIAVVADDGKLYLIDNKGHIVWSRCTANDLTSCPRTLHSTAVIADINHSGNPSIVVGGEQHLYAFNASGNILDSKRLGSSDAGANFMYYTHNADGSLEKSVPFMAAPTVAEVNGRTMIYVAAGAPSGSGADYNFGRLWAWTTGTPLGATPWPSFRGITAGRAGALDYSAPAAGIYPLPAHSPARFKVTAYGTDRGLGVASIEFQVSDNYTAWKRVALTGALYRNGTFASAALTYVGSGGHTYRFRSIIMDKVGYTTGSPTITTAVTS